MQKLWLTQRRRCEEAKRLDAERYRAFALKTLSAGASSEGPVEFFNFRTRNGYQNSS